MATQGYLCHRSNDMYVSVLLLLGFTCLTKKLLPGHGHNNNKDNHAFYSLIIPVLFPAKLNPPFRLLLLTFQSLLDTLVYNPLTTISVNLKIWEKNTNNCF